jgi:hypothetical protein
MSGNKSVVAIAAVAVIALVVGFMVMSGGDEDAGLEGDALDGRIESGRRGAGGTDTVKLRVGESGIREIDAADPSAYKQALQEALERSEEREEEARDALENAAEEVGSAVRVGGWLGPGSTLRSETGTGSILPLRSFLRSREDLGAEDMASLERTVERCRDMIQEIDLRQSKGSISNEDHALETEQIGLKCSMAVGEVLGKDGMEEFEAHVARGGARLDPRSGE